MKKKLMIVLAIVLVAMLAVVGCAQQAPAADDAADATANEAATDESADEEVAEAADEAVEAADEEDAADASDADETATDVDAKDMKFAFSGSELANPWVAMVKDGFEAGCEEAGIEFVSLNAGSDVDQQVADVENVIEGGYNALVFNPIDGNALETVLTTATDNGMPSVTIAQTADAATAGIELDDAAYGTVIGENAVEWINENLDGKGEIAVLTEDNIESSIKRGDAIVAALEAGCPDAEIVARQHANTPELGLKAIESILLQNPDLQVVVCCNDSGGIGAFQAFQNAGISGDEYGIFSGDKTDEVMGYIKEEGSIYRGTADLHPFESGYDAVFMALDYLKDGIPTEHVSVPLQMEPITQADVLAGMYD